MRISDWSSDVCSSDLFFRGTVACRLAGHAAKLDYVVPPAAQPGGAAARVVAPVSQSDSVRRGLEPEPAASGAGQIGRASCRESVCQYVSISVVAVSLKKKTL